MTFGIEKYGIFVVYTALFSLALNNNWGFDGAARSFLSKTTNGEKEIKSLYIICVYVSIIFLLIFILINHVFLYFDNNEKLFIISGVLQLSTAIAGTIYLQQNNIFAERLLFTSLNNVNFLSLIACLLTTGDINTFFIIRFALILIMILSIHCFLFKTIVRNDLIKNANKKFVVMIKRVAKYSINNLSASIIWQLNPLILSMMVTPAFIGAFSIYFRVAGLVISTQGYVFSWAVIKIKQKVNSSTTEKVIMLKQIYTVILPIAVTTSILYATASGYVIEYWIGEKIVLPQIEVSALALWMGLMILLSPLTNVVNVFDKVDTMWVLTGVLSALCHCGLITTFKILLDLPLIAFPISLLLVPVPVTLYYVYVIIYRQNNQI